MKLDGENAFSCQCATCSAIRKDRVQYAGLAAHGIGERMIDHVLHLYQLESRNPRREIEVNVVNPDQNWAMFTVLRQAGHSKRKSAGAIFGGSSADSRHSLGDSFFPDGSIVV